MRDKKSKNRPKKETVDKPLVCDFVGGPTNYRLHFGGGRGQGLARAAGLKPGVYPHIIDATAGMGRDAFLLASLGAKVTLIERSALMYDLLEEGMGRARAAGGINAQVIARMRLIKGDSIELLPGLSPEIIVVDPMHPVRQKSALVKVEMRQIREIVGVDEDQHELMQIALASASKRVVLKWPSKAAPMVGLPPCSHQVIGKSTRYDVFMRPVQTP